MPSPSPHLTFIFELQYYRGSKFIQRFHCYFCAESGSKIIWDQAWVLFELQSLYRSIRKTECNVADKL